MILQGARRIAENKSTKQVWFGGFIVVFKNKYVSENLVLTC